MGTRMRRLRRRIVHKQDRVQGLPTRSKPLCTSNWLNRYKLTNDSEAVTCKRCKACMRRESKP